MACGVVWFAGLCAIHPEVELQATVIVHVSARPAEAEMLEAFWSSQNLADRK